MEGIQERPVLRLPPSAVPREGPVLGATSSGFWLLVAPSSRSPRDQVELHPDTFVVVLGEGCPQGPREQVVNGKPSR